VVDFDLLCALSGIYLERETTIVKKNWEHYWGEFETKLYIVIYCIKS